MTGASRGAPFIIWTLQRTGGTNLARRLIEYSGLLESARRSAAPGSPAAHLLDGIADQWMLHEPFNSRDPKRAFSRVTDRWLAAQDAAALESAVGEICSLRLPMKHCVDMVPWEISAALAVASVRYGYEHVVLYRENTLNRLLSLHFAKVSGVWGSHSPERQLLGDHVFAEPLPVRELVRHAGYCNKRLEQAWDLLADLGAEPAVLAFEDVFEAASAASARDVLVLLLADIGLAKDQESDRKFTADAIRWGDQGTRDSYARFRGLEELKDALARVGSPVLAGPAVALRAEAVHGGLPSLVHAALDADPGLVRAGRGFAIGGVAVLRGPMPPEAGLCVAVNGTEHEIRWGIPSPVTARRFPEGANSANARFRVDGVRCRRGRTVELVLRTGAGERTPLFLLRAAEEALQPAPAA
jgi:hypothetical protein